MLYKEDKFDNWHHREWRYWCECGYPDHVLMFDESMEDNDISLDLSIMSSPNWSFWQRVKECFRILFYKDICYTNVMISEEDRKELGAAIAGERIVT